MFESLPHDLQLKIASLTGTHRVATHRVKLRDEPVHSDYSNWHSKEEEVMRLSGCIYKRQLLCNLAIEDMEEVDEEDEPDAWQQNFEFEIKKQQDDLVIGNAEPEYVEIGSIETRCLYHYPHMCLVAKRFSTIQTTTNCCLDTEMEIQEGVDEVDAPPIDMIIESPLDVLQTHFRTVYTLASIIKMWKTVAK